METTPDSSSEMNYDLVLSAALKLSSADRLRLVDDVVSSVPEDAHLELSEEWNDEIARRVAEMDSGEAEVDSWEDVRRNVLKLREGRGDT